jgi:NAD(P) transhydrogenase subunit alpha
MDSKTLLEQITKLEEVTQQVIKEARNVESLAKNLVAQSTTTYSADPFIAGLTVFVLACFVGYYVVWKVTPAFHSPLMSVTNAISSVVIVGALIAAAPLLMGFSTWVGLLAIALASVNIFGGFIITQRMLQMFQKSK